MPATDQQSKAMEFAWATRRSRLGLILGPGSILVFACLTLFGPAPEWSSRWDGNNPLPVFVVVVLHVASLIECIATVRMLDRTPCPITVWLLAIYWVLPCWACLSLVL